MYARQHAVAAECKTRKVTDGVLRPRFVTEGVEHPTMALKVAEHRQVSVFRFVQCCSFVADCCKRCVRFVILANRFTTCNNIPTSITLVGKVRKA